MVGEHVLPQLPTTAGSVIATGRPVRVRVVKVSSLPYLVPLALLLLATIRK
jgi:hypothetical protein